MRARKMCIVGGLAYNEGKALVEYVERSLKAAGIKYEKCYACGAYSTRVKILFANSEGMWTFLKQMKERNLVRIWRMRADQPIWRTRGRGCCGTESINSIGRSRWGSASATPRICSLRI